MVASSSSSSAAATATRNTRIPITIHNLSEACDFFVRKAANAGIQLYAVGSIQGDRGPICVIFNQVNNSTRHYVMYKTEWFWTFHRIFNKPGAGWGQTVNMRIIDDAAAYSLRNQCEAYLESVMPSPDNGAIYFIDAQNMSTYVLDNNTIRIPKNETGEEGSTPSRMWTRRNW